MEDKALKICFTGFGSILTYMYGNFTPLISILVILEVIDYITGVASAKKNFGLSSEEAFWGFIRKVFYFFLIAVAFCFDFVIAEAGTILSIDFEWPAIFGVMSVCYLISAEALSILENLSELGVEAPFLKTALKSFSRKIEEKSSEAIKKEEE